MLVGVREKQMVTAWGLGTHPVEDTDVSGLNEEHDNGLVAAQHREHQWRDLRRNWAEYYNTTRIIARIGSQCCTILYFQLLAGTGKRYAYVIQMEIL